MKSFKQITTDFGKPERGWRARAYTIIFEADTVTGRRFDLALLMIIVMSVVTVIADSVVGVNNVLLFNVLEWVFTLLFTAEYVVRLMCVRHPWRYATSFFGIIDLLSVLPSYLAFFMPEFHLLIDVRLLRMLRIFRIMKITRYFNESQVLWQALRNSRYKILVFLCTMFILSIILGTLMYVVEGPQNGFTSIPVSMYWAIVTMTTTGYGDIHPKTPLGQFITSCSMLLGYGVIALPTGIVGAELAMTMSRRPPTTRTCSHCLTEGHEAAAVFCMHCGEKLDPYESDPVISGAAGRR